MEELSSTLHKTLSAIRQASSRGDLPGAPAVRPDRAPNCTRCGDRGIYLVGGRGVICPCMKERSLTRNFRTARLAPEVRNCSFEGFNLRYYSRQPVDQANGSTTCYDTARKALAAARQFVRGYLEGKPVRGLLLCGPVGSGKTFLARAVANALLEGGRSVFFVVVPDLLDEIRATYDARADNTASEQQLMETARGVEVLILDDLGAFTYTEWARNKLFSIINHRLLHQLPTLITTNLELEELEDYIGERTTSRLVELCAVYRLLVDRDIRYVINREKRGL